MVLRARVLEALLGLSEAQWQITCEVTGIRKRSSVEGKGLVIPCLYKFEAGEKFIVRLHEVFEKKRSAKKAH